VEYHRGLDQSVGLTHQPNVWEIEENGIQDQGEEQQKNQHHRPERQATLDWDVPKWPLGRRVCGTLHCKNSRVAELLILQN
jgi:hypothetical protein